MLTARGAGWSTTSWHASTSRAPVLPPSLSRVRAAQAEVLNRRRVTAWQCTIQSATAIRAASRWGNAINRLRSCLDARRATSRRARRRRGQAAHSASVRSGAERGWFRPALRPDEIVRSRSCCSESGLRGGVVELVCREIVGEFSASDELPERERRAVERVIAGSLPEPTGHVPPRGARQPRRSGLPRRGSAVRREAEGRRRGPACGRARRATRATLRRSAGVFPNVPTPGRGGSTVARSTVATLATHVEACADATGAVTDHNPDRSYEVEVQPVPSGDDGHGLERPVPPRERGERGANPDSPSTSRIESLGPVAIATFALGHRSHPCTYGLVMR